MGSGLDHPPPTGVLFMLDQIDEEISLSVGENSGHVQVCMPRLHLHNRHKESRLCLYTQYLRSRS